MNEKQTLIAWGISDSDSFILYPSAIKACDDLLGVRCRSNRDAETCLCDSMYMCIDTCNGVLIDF